MARQENLFLPESFKRIVIQTLFRSHERDIVNINYSPMKNSSCLEIKVDLKMCEKLSFWNQGWFQGWLEIKVKFRELPWNQGCFQNVPEFPFHIYSTHCYNLHAKKEQKQSLTSAKFNFKSNKRHLQKTKSLREVTLYFEGETNASLAVKPCNLMKS